MVNNSTNINKTNTKKERRHMTLEIQVLAWDRYTNMVKQQLTRFIKHQIRIRRNKNKLTRISLYMQFMGSQFQLYL